MIGKPVTVMCRLVALAGAVLIGWGVVAPSQAQELPTDPVKLTSLHWPPYTGETLPGQGLTGFIVREAFREAGLGVDVEFLSWRRAVREATTDDQYQGYFPEYKDATIEKDFLYSDPIGTSQVGFAESTLAPLEWNELADLKRVVIGVVSAYVNGPDFDSAQSTGTLNTVDTFSDTSNLKGLTRGYYRASVIDRRVFDYLLSTHPFLRRKADRLQFNDRTLSTLTLHVCFRRHAGAETLRDMFNEGLKKVDIDSATEKYLAYVEMFNTVK